MARMTQFVRPLSCLCNTFQHRLVISVVAVRPRPQQHRQRQKKNQLPYSSASSSLDFQSRGLRLLQTPQPSETQESSSSSSDSELQDKKSRNERKREARRAVHWGMELATFSVPQIKQILSATSLDQEVFDAIMLVKRLGSDVREGKRRQFNYIGRLLRDVEAELMDGLIQASKEGDQSKLQELSGGTAAAASYIIEEESECEAEEDVGDLSGIADRWLDGLIDNDTDITNEVYSIHTVEFDRQELRKLVRRVKEHNNKNKNKNKNKVQSEAAAAPAKKPLLAFLRSLAKQMNES